MVLGPTAETSLRQTLMMFKGNMLLIFDRPIASSFLYLLILFMIIEILYPFLRRQHLKIGEKKISK